MKRMLKPLLLGCLLTLLLPATALAQDFEGIVAEGMKYYSEGNYDAAVEKFFEAKLLRDEPELVYNIARSYHRKGDCRAAKSNYETFLNRGDAPDATSAKAKTYLEELGECPTTGVLTLACTPADAMVSINGQEMGTCGELELEEGTYALIVSADGYQPSDRRAEIVAGEKEALSVILEEEEVVETGPNWLGIGLVSGGGALILTAVVVDIVNWQGNAKELEKYPVGDSRRADFEDKYELNQVIIGVTGGLGLAILGTGIVLWVLDIGGGGGSETAEAESRDEVTWQVTPAVNQDGAGASFKLTF